MRITALAADGRAEFHRNGVAGSRSFRRRIPPAFDRHGYASSPAPEPPGIPTRSGRRSASHPALAGCRPGVGRCVKFAPATPSGFRRRKTLAWRNGRARHGTCCHAGSPRRRARDLARAGDRRAVFRETRLSCASTSREHRNRGSLPVLCLSRWRGDGAFANVGR